MSNSITLMCEASIIEKMQSAYSDCLVKTPSYAIFSAKCPGATITAYQSGKVLFQGKQAEFESQKWNGLKSESKKANQAKLDATDLPNNFEQLSIVGSDEVGNGSYLGPVVVCASYVKTDQIPILKELGVKDSKLLKDPDIIKLADKLKPIIEFKCLVVEPSKYNDIQPEYNVNRMKVALHNQAIYLLLNQLDALNEKPQGILIDQFTPESNYRNYLASEKNQVTDNLYFKTKGEQYHLAVASASIICRARFLEELDKMSQELGFTIPSGAGDLSNEVAARILKIGGMPLLRKYAKLHFANTQKAQALM